MADNFSSGFANFMTETPVFFGVNFQNLAGIGQGLPTLGGDNYLEDALGAVGTGVTEFLNDSRIPNVIQNYIGLPLSLLVIDSYMSETHNVTSTITNDPVESGPNITSHAYPNPAIVTINFVVNDNFFSEFSVGGHNLSNAPFVGSINRVALSYLVLDTIRRSSTPLFLTTRTYIYSSMLIQGITVTRDLHYYTRGMFTVTMKQLFQANSFGSWKNPLDKPATTQPGVGGIINTGNCPGTSDTNLPDDSQNMRMPPNQAQMS